MNSFTTALTTIRRSPYQTLVAILMVSVTFFVGFSFSYFITGASVILTHFERQPQIISFFELETSQDSINQVVADMEEKPFVESITVKSNEDALKLYQEENKDEPLLLELVTADILPASIEISATNIENLEIIKTDLEQYDFIEDVDYQEDVIDILAQWINTAEIIGIITISVLTFNSFIIIMVVIAMKASSHKKTFSVMRMLGATKWYIKTPLMIEGMIYGLAGAVIGWFTAFAILLYLTPSIDAVFGDIKLFPIPPEFYLVHFGTGILLAIILGAFASLVAVHRLIKL